MSLRFVIYAAVLLFFVLVIAAFSLLAPTLPTATRAITAGELAIWRMQIQVIWPPLAGRPPMQLPRLSPFQPIHSHP